MKSENGFSLGGLATLATMATNTEAGPDYHGFTLTELEAEAADDWQEIQNDPRQLEAFAKSLSQRRGMVNGRVPDHYTKAVECAHCGPVRLWEGAPDHVSGCPWCLNKCDQYKEMT